MKIVLLILVCIGTLFSCKTPEARRPISTNSGSYINESVARNKKLIEDQEKAIQEIITSATDPYTASENGFWYTYVIKDSVNAPKPIKGDLVLFEYAIATLGGSTILSKEELGPQIYQIDQSNQDLISGLRDGLKLMQEGEKMSFLFPSHKAYGYYGLDGKIGSNIPLKVEVSLNEIKKEH